MTSAQPTECLVFRARFSETNEHRARLPVLHGAVTRPDKAPIVDPTRNKSAWSLSEALRHHGGHGGKVFSTRHSHPVRPLSGVHALRRSSRPSLRTKAATSHKLLIRPQNPPP